MEKTGAWLSYGNVRLGQGRENARSYLRDNPALLEELTQKILQKRGLLPEAAASETSNARPQETAVRSKK